MRIGKLKHRITIQYPVEVQDQETGESIIEWTDLAKVWSRIEPISARDFISAQSQQSKIMARIVLRYRSDIEPKMRILYKSTLYNIEGDLPDKDSGTEYLTLPVSCGVRYKP